MIHPQPISESDSTLLSINSLREWTRTTDDEFSDVELLDLGLGALHYVEGKSSVILLPRIYTARFSDFCDYYIPLYPFVSIDTIKYRDADNVEQTLSATDYTVESYSKVNNKLVYTATSLPTVYDRWDAVTVTMKAGYGHNADNLPSNIRQSIRHLVRYWYDNPDSPKKEAPSLVDDIIRTFAIDVFA